MRSARAVFMLAVVVVTPAALVASETAPPAFGLPLAGADAEHFLRTAEVVEMSSIDRGVTRPTRLALSDGRRTLHAVFKSIDDFRPVQRFERRRAEIGFKDSYKHEIAAYLLDRLLALDLVPPTVERSIDGRRGSMQLWVEGTITEGDRIKQGLEPPHPQLWNNQIFTIRLFLQLTYDTDYNNVNNLLVDPEYRIYAIDFSRAFRPHGTLPREESLTRFSRSLLERLDGLDRGRLEQTLSGWLSKEQIGGLWQRRCRILELARERVAAAGEAVVLFP